jgi:methylmalonyl-CoA mutase N-terminal domain/subunit
MKLRFHTQTAGSTLTAQSPENNIVRVALQALSAVLGGTQSLHTNSFDEALALPTERSAKIALRTQQVIASETGVTRSVDPLGGSHLVESLTDAIEEKVWDYLDEIDRRGGALACIENGFIKGEIEDSAYAHQLSVERGDRQIVGVNCYRDNDAKGREIDLSRVDPGLEAAQVERLKRVKTDRNARDAEQALARLSALRDDENVMPLLIDAVKKRVSVGEICRVFRKRFGEYKENL